MQTVLAPSSTNLVQQSAQPRPTPTNSPTQLPGDSGQLPSGFRPPNEPPLGITDFSRRALEILGHRERTANEVFKKYCDGEGINRKTNLVKWIAAAGQTSGSLQALEGHGLVKSRTEIRQKWNRQEVVVLWKRTENGTRVLNGISGSSAAAEMGLDGLTPA